MNMKLARRGFSTCMACLAVAAGPFAFSTAAWAQDRYPSKAIEIIVPFAAGGATDVGSRIIAEGLQKKWNVPVKVINQPGANSAVAGEYVMKSAPDGYTILADSTPATSGLAVSVPNLSYKMSDRSRVAIVSTVPVFLFVSSSSPFEVMSDVIDEAYRNTTSFTWTKIAGVSELTMRKMFAAGGINHTLTRPVSPKGGGSDGALLVGSGQVTFGGAGYSSMSAMLSAKKLRVLAVAAPKRSTNLPEVPTTAEAGYPSIIGIQWNGFTGPKGLPADVVATWRTAVKEVVNDPATIAAFQKLGLEPGYMDGPDMDRLIDDELAVFQKFFPLN